MGWSIGFDSNWDRDIGYGVPAICDYPGCNEKIDRGLSYVCGGDAYGGEKGCGLFFCSNHQHFDEEGTQLCERCMKSEDEDYEPFEAKPDTDEWINHKLTDESWAEWRKENPNFLPTKQT
jgi:hypothetical protein